jgi:hypothetical protein
VTIFGGLCDLDSVVGFKEVKSDGFFAESLHQCANAIAVSIEKLTGLPRTGAAEYLRVYTNRVIREALQSEARPGLTLDPRVLKALNPSSIADMLSLLASGAGKTEYRA